MRELGSGEGRGIGEVREGLKGKRQEVTRSIVEALGGKFRSEFQEFRSGFQEIRI